MSPAVIAERGPLSQAALGELPRIERTTVVAVVDELERAGYVNRGRYAADRRVHSLITPTGRRVLGDRGLAFDLTQADLLPSRRTPVQPLVHQLRFELDTLHHLPPGPVRALSGHSSSSPPLGLAEAAGRSM